MVYESVGGKTFDTCVNALGTKVCNLLCTSPLLSTFLFLHFLSLFCFVLFFCCLFLVVFFVISFSAHLPGTSDCDRRDIGLPRRLRVLEQAGRRRRVTRHQAAGQVCLCQRLLPQSLSKVSALLCFMVYLLSFFFCLLLSFCFFVFLIVFLLFFVGFFFLFFCFILFSFFCLFVFSSWLITCTLLSIGLRRSTWQK